MEQARIDALYLEFCNEAGTVMDSDEDREQHTLIGHLYSENFQPNLPPR